MKHRIINAKEHHEKVRCVEGTLALEELELTEASRHNLDRYASGQASCEQIVAEWKEKYDNKTR